MSSAADRRGASAHPIDDGSEAGGIFARLPKPLRPLSGERQGDGRRRRVEATILIGLALLLAVASVYDVTRQVRINYRLTADIATWHEVTKLTGKTFEELDVEQNLKTYTKRDIVCGNTSPGKPGKKQQICLVMKGPIVKGRREATGGFFLPPKTPDRPTHRYGCFGAPAKQHFCTQPIPPDEPIKLPKAFGG